MLELSGSQLYDILKTVYSVAKKSVASMCYTSDIEIMFEYQSNVHFMGIRYNKGYDTVSLYIDKDVYDTLDDVYFTATLCDTQLVDIENGIMVFNDYSELLWG